MTSVKIYDETVLLRTPRRWGRPTVWARRLRSQHDLGKEGLVEARWSRATHASLCTAARVVMSSQRLSGCPESKKKNFLMYKKYISFKKYKPQRLKNSLFIHDSFLTYNWLRAEVYYVTLRCVNTRTVLNTSFPWYLELRHSKYNRLFFVIVKFYENSLIILFVMET